MLKSSSLLGGLALLGCTAAPGATSTPAGATGLLPEASGGYRFFTEEEARTVDAVVSRLRHGAAHDHGAAAADVTLHLDHRLASLAGDGEHGHRSNPSSQGLYHLGVPALDRYSQTRFGSLFADLPERRQDEVLRVLDATWRRSEKRSGDGGATEQEMDQAEDVFGDVDPGEFFATLRKDVTESMHRTGGNPGRAGAGREVPQHPHALGGWRW